MKKIKLFFTLLIVLVTLIGCDFFERKPEFVLTINKEPKFLQSKEIVERLQKIAGGLHKVSFRILENTDPETEPNRIAVKLDSLVDELISKTEWNVLDNVFETISQLKDCNTRLEKLLGLLESDAAEINELIIEVKDLCNRLIAERQVEIETGITRKIFEIKKIPSEIRQLIALPEFESQIGDEKYVKELNLYIANEMDLINEFVDKSDFQNLLTNKDFANSIILEVQLVLREIEVISKQIQTEHNAALQKVSDEEAKKLLSEEEEKRLQAEEDAKKLLAEEEEKRRKAEEEIKRLEEELEYANRVRTWTTVIYMAADNNLEPYAIQDINELEASFNDSDDMNVLVLLDRSELYDKTNDDWSDTRLFLIKKDPAGLDGTIRSKRIDCPDIDIYKNKETELDMGNPYTLSGLMNFAKKEYKANHYALIIWGHGNGWRSASLNDDNLDFSRAVASDDKTDSYMTVPNLGNAVRSKGFDIIAFDTCFGAVIENFYELKDSTTCLVGAAGLVPSVGMDYSMFLSSYGKSDKSIFGVADCIANCSQEPISIVQTDFLQEIANGINSLATEIASTITNVSTQSEIRQINFSSVKSYRKESYPSDFFLDVYSFAEKYSTFGNSKIKKIAAELMALMKQGIVTVGSDTPEMGIYYGDLVNSQSLATVYSPSYTNGSVVSDKSKFVQQMTGWVPTEKGNISLLDKLFNVTF